MTDTRQVLEEAWEHLCQTSLSFRRYACTTIPGGDGWTMTGKFCRFLDAEAWTDAALCLVPEGWGWNVSQPNAKAIASGLLKEETPVRGEVENGFEQRFIVAGETPALAIAQAALRAKEAGNV